MRVERLTLDDIRCFTTVDVELSDGVTLIVGGNGQGKTSLLEALGWLALGRSFRGAPDAAIVRVGAPRGVIRAAVRRAEHERWLEVELAPGGRSRYRVNQSNVSRSAELRESLQATVFAPDDLRLIKGGPAERRELLDDLLTALAPRFGAALRDVERVVRHRNALLKSGIRHADDARTLDVLDEQLVRHAAVVVEGRLRLIDRLRTPLQAAYELLAGTPSEILLTYESEWAPNLEGARADGPIGPEIAERVQAVATALMTALIEHRKRELDRGVSLVGPFRDDLGIALTGMPARTHASQGEQRCLALGLRIAGHRVIEEVLGEPPVLLLDDVFSELDATRSTALVESLPRGQTIVTSASVLPPELRADLRLVVSQGTVSRI